jgi:hypothetical protein
LLDALTEQLLHEVVVVERFLLLDELNVRD